MPAHSRKKRRLLKKMRTTPRRNTRVSTVHVSTAAPIFYHPPGGGRLSKIAWATTRSIPLFANFPTYIFQHASRALAGALWDLINFRGIRVNSDPSLRQLARVNRVNRVERRVVIVGSSFYRGRLNFSAMSTGTESELINFVNDDLIFPQFPDTNGKLLSRGIGEYKFHVYLPVIGTALEEFARRVGFIRNLYPSMIYKRYVLRRAAIR